jgi:hypothetical protein
MAVDQVIVKRNIITDHCYTCKYPSCMINFDLFTQEIQQLELLCKHLYESSDPVQRQEAEKTLVGFQVDYYIENLINNIICGYLELNSLK